MFCSKCEKENNEDAKFCRFCGNLLKQVLEEDSKLLPTTQTKRLLNLILDSIGVILFSLLVGFLLGIVGLYSLIEGIDDTLFGIILSLAYYMIFESIWSKTPAKFITKTKVITETGEKPDYGTIFKRTLIRLIPFEAFSFLGSKCPRGWHDRWSNTIVTDEKR